MAARVARLVTTATSWSAPALVLYRQLPKVKRYLAYLPEGPVIDWAGDDLGDLARRRWPRHLKEQGAFGVRMGPPVVTRRWTAAQVKDGIADPDVRRLGDVPPDRARRQPAPGWSPSCDELGWRQQAAEGGFAAGQPQYVFQIPLRRHAHRGRRAQGHEPAVAPQHQEGRQGGRRGHRRAATAEDLKAFHDLYVHTAERDHFTPRPLAYFRTMFDALSRRGARPDPL